MNEWQSFAIILALTIVLLAGVVMLVQRTNATRTKHASVQTREPPPFAVSLSVPGMHCAHCEARISQLLRVVPGVTKVHADAHRKRVRVECKHGLSYSSDVNSLIAALAKGGYDAMVEQ